MDGITAFIALGGALIGMNLMEIKKLLDHENRITEVKSKQDLLLKNQK